LVIIENIYSLLIGNDGRVPNKKAHPGERASVFVLSIDFYIASLTGRTTYLYLSPSIGVMVAGAFALTKFIVI
jgi:hypothetical protein